MKVLATVCLIGLVGGCIYNDASVAGMPEFAGYMLLDLVFGTIVAAGIWRKD